jgi:hypothetical protein
VLIQTGVFQLGIHWVYFEPMIPLFPQGPIGFRLPLLDRVFVLNLTYLMIYEIVLGFLKRNSITGKNLVAKNVWSQDEPFDSEYCSTCRPCRFRATFVPVVSKVIHHTWTSATCPIQPSRSPQVLLSYLAMSRHWSLQPDFIRNALVKSHYDWSKCPEMRNILQQWVFMGKIMRKIMF